MFLFTNDKNRKNASIKYKKKDSQYLSYYEPLKRILQFLTKTYSLCYINNYANNYLFKLLY
jgi:hypothetical protein